MAGICLDIVPLTNIVNSKGWYAELREDIETRKILVWISAGQYDAEAKKNIKVQLWLNSLAEAGKVKSVDGSRYSVGLRQLKSNPVCQCRDCDDLHLFSLCAVARSSYLFTEDRRIAKCRKRMARRTELRGFCMVRLIYKQREYKEHRQKLSAH